MQSGRQESNLPTTAYQTVAAPLGFGPKKAPCTGIEPVSPARQADRHTSGVTRRNQRAPGGSRTRLSTMARWCLDRSATGASVSRDGRSRTFSTGFGGPLLTQEHVPVSETKPTAPRTGFEPAIFSVTGRRGLRSSTWVFIEPDRSCPGRTRTCTPPVNSRSHNLLCCGAITQTADTQGVEP